MFLSAEANWHRRLGLEQGACLLETVLTYYNS